MLVNVNYKQIFETKRIKILEFKAVIFQTDLFI